MNNFSKLIKKFNLEDCGTCIDYALDLFNNASEMAVIIENGQIIYNNDVFQIGYNKDLLWIREYEEDIHYFYLFPISVIPLNESLIKRIKKEARNVII